MKKFINWARQDGGYDDGALLIALPLSAFAIALSVLWFTSVDHSSTPYTRISVDRCFDSKVGAEWLYVEDGDRLPKMGGDVSDTPTRVHGRAIVRTADR